jgi:peptide/nickel transport system substrate-binding protein
VFNQNDLSSGKLLSIQRKQSWFRDAQFRQAISAAIDRDAIVQLVYRGMASPIWTQVTEGNKLWLNGKSPHTPHSIPGARELLRAAGFSWNSANRLLDPSKNEVSFSILTSAGNSQREKISTLVQDDLKQIGITASIVSLEFRSMMDRIFNTYDYEAAVMTLASGDVDPNSEMNVWTVNGSTHLWNLGSKAPEGWEKEIDQLMRRQLISVSFEERRQLYARVQELVAANLPIICLASPHVLVGASRRVQNLHPSILRPYALWNADALFLDGPGGSR